MVNTLKFKMLNMSGAATYGMPGNKEYAPVRPEQTPEPVPKHLLSIGLHAYLHWS